MAIQVGTCCAVAQPGHKYPARGHDPRRRKVDAAYEDHKRLAGRNKADERPEQRQLRYIRIAIEGGEHEQGGDNRPAVPATARAGGNLRPRNCDSTPTKPRTTTSPPGANSDDLAFIPIDGHYLGGTALARVHCSTPW